MKIYHYFGGGSSGVARFDGYLRWIFSEMISCTKLPKLCENDWVVTDNHLSLDVPEVVRALVVHHGCALAHFDRDEAWQTGANFVMADAQLKMFMLMNRMYIAPSSWVAETFRKETALGEVYRPAVVPHWVETILSLSKSGKPKIIGDWRDNNKGKNVWLRLAERYPQWDFVPLNFRYDIERHRQYGEASLYLCLSLSEGGSYSMCDAEAAELPIVTTDVGNYHEFDDCEVIRWQDRDDLEIVGDAIERKLRAGRAKPSFYRDYTFHTWAERWRSIVL